MTLAQRCDEIIRLIDEALAAEASAELAALSARPQQSRNGASGWTEPMARR